MYKLAGHKALITGASKGVGSAIAQELAQNGCSVTLLARNRQLLTEKCLTLPKVVSKQSHLYIDYDLQDILQGPDKRIAESLEGTSILVNCAGITTHSLLPRCADKGIIQTINTNLIAPIILTKMASKPMLASIKQLKNSPVNSPVVLNIASVLSLTDTHLKGTTVYAASKAGLLGFTTSLASEFDGKIRLNALLPSLILETEMGARANVLKGVPVVSLKKVVEEALAAITDTTINGQLIVVDSEEDSKPSSRLNYK